jgi:hypothetical protein
VDLGLGNSVKSVLKKGWMMRKKSFCEHGERGNKKSAVETADEQKLLA